MKSWSTDVARSIAYSAHDGQTDRLGEDYIEHPKAVAERVASYAGPQQLEAARQVAWLHDVLEDTELSIDDLRDHGCPADVCDAVQTLTRRADEAYLEYIERLAPHPLARIVKLADLDHNLDPHRFSQLPKEVQDKLRARYLPARAHLLQVQGELPLTEQIAQMRTQFQLYEDRLDTLENLIANLTLAYSEATSALEAVISELMGPRSEEEREKFRQELLTRHQQTLTMLQEARHDDAPTDESPLAHLVRQQHARDTEHDA